jgi:SpoVK/Ycf46/Vps4 family AAA+-type ATPase
MEKVKENIIDHILYFIQNLHSNNSELLHIVIKGPPGTGKTELGKILGEIYYKLNIIEQPRNYSSWRKRDKLSDDENEDKMIFRIVSRSDLIGGYLGQTALKTQRVIDSCLGGIMFIDEAYSLGNESLSDSYAKECIDTLNLNLTEKKNSLLCIIAGYNDQLDKCFFSYNPGLQRRFPFIYEIENYSYKQLFNIFLYKLSNDNWEIDELITDIFFKDNYKYFPNFGGDIETFIFNSKIKHGKRIFNNDKCKYKTLSLEDITEGIKILKSKYTITDKDTMISMYL